MNILNNVLVFGYESGNVDFFYNEENIENFSAIFDYPYETKKK